MLMYFFQFQRMLLHLFKSIQHLTKLRRVSRKNMCFQSVGYFKLKRKFVLVNKIDLLKVEEEIKSDKKNTN